MIESDVIIVGGGPAGSAAAWKLKQNNVKCLVLDKSSFPRLKLCAGWITPKVFHDLELDKYPHSITRFDRIHSHVWGISRKMKTLQYSIRRYEFDSWLLKRSGADVINHNVQKIKESGGKYIIDNKYRCKYLIGAGGTNCPVYSTFFKGLNPREEKSMVVAMEAEFRYHYKEKDCILWFFRNRLPGYSWYVPKGNGFLNIGIGGLFTKMKSRKRNIQEHWNLFAKELEGAGLVAGIKLKPQGYVYYLRQEITSPRIKNAFIVGDAAGLATKDLGEGIGPAVESSILAADSIVNNTEYSLESVTKKSVPFLKLLSML